MATSPLSIPLNVINAHRAIANPFVPEVCAAKTIPIFSLYHFVTSKHSELLKMLDLFETQNHSASLGCLGSIRNYKNRKKKLFFLLGD